MNKSLPKELHGNNHAAQNRVNTQLRQLKEFGKNPLTATKAESPIKKPYIYDTKEGIDFFTRTLKEESTEKLTPEKNAEIDKLNTDMKNPCLNII